MNIAETASKIHENAKAKGFFEEGDQKNIGEMLMLIVTEASEAMEADRKSHYCTNREVIECLEVKRDTEFTDAFEFGIKHSFGDELADIFIRVLDMAAFKKIDLESHVIAKMRYNKLRPHKHGGKKC